MQERTTPLPAPQQPAPQRPAGERTIPVHVQGREVRLQVDTVEMLVRLEGCPRLQPVMGEHFDDFSQLLRLADQGRPMQRYDNLLRGYAQALIRQCPPPRAR